MCREPQKTAIYQQLLLVLLISKNNQHKQKLFAVYLSRTLELEDENGFARFWHLRVIWHCKIFLELF